MQKLLTDYQLDNDLEDTNIEAYVTDKDSEDKEVFIICAKIAEDTNYR
ncbi:hypothetical protein HZC00_03605 [Candidatus Kaiserbacteria bacterium]|nr:hypothetical protein [Candidatus Kaiserbacteria bacterium]